MGYKPNRKLYRLEFEDYPGLEITATSTSLGKLMHLASMELRLGSGIPESERTELFEFFASKIVTWNVEHPELDTTREDGTCLQCGLAEGAPLPTTLEGILCLDLTFTMSIIIGWMTTLTKASLPKGMSLKNGGIVPEDLMKQLGELQSPPKLPTPNLS